MLKYNKADERMYRHVSSLMTVVTVISKGSTHLIDVMKKTGSVQDTATLKRTKFTKIVTNRLASMFRKLIITDMVRTNSSF